ncbi:hypothetical protein ACIRBX_25490 [Kitasatospora sp. NPDC096147]|uniref:hypothetical protein n=1 Tax=Kitasatospora sp. NPDC096147 TaxID=3364093 RepID=UPI0038264DF0
MRTRIAAAAVGMTALLAVPATASAAPATTPGVTAGPVSCATDASFAGNPCVWQERDAAGLAGVARLIPTAGLPVVAKVELKTQRAWGSPWVTVSSTTALHAGPALLTTPKVVTNELSIVCVTTTPALSPGQQSTLCTHPSA